MQKILADHNCEGQAEAIFNALRYHGFSSLISIELVLFHDVGLTKTAKDVDVWRLCQEAGYLLLTGNRTADDGAQSLEVNINRFLTADSLPVVTIGNLRRVMVDPEYCWRCAEDLVEFVLDLNNVRGVPRVYIPNRAVHQ
jgi:hypothetical protein